ncbi:MAG: DMT family transporter, partial [Rhodospirillaceae bacterium]|nr:DMT family transporter [Rhodospirillaceae bacterium]
MPLTPPMFALFAALFLLFWSTGFVAAKFGLPYAEPLTFLGTRFVIASVLMLLLCFVLRASWPRRLREYGHIIIAGLLVQIGYLIGVYYGIYLGVSIGIMALIVGLQPLVTSVLVGPLLGESVSPRQRLGLVLGFGGLGLVVAEKVAFGEAVWLGYLLGLMALVAIT